MIKPRKKTLTRESLLRILKAEQPFLKEHFGVKRIAIFGSFAKGKPTVKSDVDIYVEFNVPKVRNFFGLIDYLEKKITGRQIDVLTLGAIRSMRVGRIAQDIQGSLLDV